MFEKHSFFRYIPRFFLVALAALIIAGLAQASLPGSAEAAAPNTPNWDSDNPAVSGDRTMELDWSTASGATGYQYRYANQVSAFLEFQPGQLPPCNDPCFRSDWLTASTTGDDTNKTIGNMDSDPELTVGTTYWFQLRAVNNEGTTNDDSDDTYSDLAIRTIPDTDPPQTETTVSALQRAAPAKLVNVQATAGNREVTLSWDNPNDDTITNYDYRQSDDGGSNWGGWNNFVPTTSSHTVTGLSNGTTYSFQVRANNLIGGGAESDSVTATPSGPPAAPDLRATPGEGEVRLFWADLNDASITKFQHRKRITSAAADAWDPNWDDIELSSAATVELTVTGLTNDTEYTFEVRAVNDQGDGAAASITATPTPAETAPSAMSNVQHIVTDVSEGSGGKVTFTWDNPSNAQIDEYQYRYDASSNNPPPCDENEQPAGCGWDADWTKIDSSDASTTSWAPSIPGSSATVFYQLRAVNNGADDADTEDVNEGGGPWTAITVSRTNTPVESTAPPGAPGSLTATPGVVQVTLSWTAPTTPDGTSITKYQYRQSSEQDTEGNAVWTEWADITTTTSEGTISGTVSSLSDGTTYIFEVRAFHDNKTDSDTTDDVPGAAAQAEAVTPGAPNAPTDLTASADADEQITLSWMAGADITDVTVTGYQYRQRASGEANWGEWKEITGSDATTTTFSVTGLDIGTYYEFQVRAVSDSGESQASPTASATTITPTTAPAKPAKLTATPGPGDDSVTLTWDSPDDLKITSYRYRTTTTLDSSDDPDFLSAPWQIIVGSGSGTTSHEVTGLEVGTVHYFQIQARSSQGNSPDSDVVSARPAPVRGEWSFEAVIEPNPLKSGNEDGAAVKFIATYKVTSGTPTDLSLSIEGGTSSISTNFASQDSGKVGLKDLQGVIGGVASRGVNVTYSSGAPTCDSPVKLRRRAIVCEFSSLTKLFAAANATPGSYTGTLSTSDGLRFVATASHRRHTGFVSAVASEIGPFNLRLEVIPGPPDAPTSLTADGGNSRVTLNWDDPGNPNITGHQYQRTTTAPGITLGWDGSTDSDVARYQYRHTTTEPDIQLSWSYPGGFIFTDDVVYEYRHTTTEPGVTLSWTDSGIAEITRYEYRSTTATTSEGDPDFSGVTTWTQIPDSGPTTTSFKVTGLDLGETHYFEVRPFTTSEGDTLTTLTTTVEYFDGSDWMLIPDSIPATGSHRITGLDLYETHYFEVRPVKDGEALSNVDPLTVTVQNFDAATWADIPDSGLGEANRASYKVTATEITGLDLRVSNYFEVRPVRAGLPRGDRNRRHGDGQRDPVVGTVRLRRRR